jgi:hypothetical protein
VAFGGVGVDLFVAGAVVAVEPFGHAGDVETGPEDAVLDVAGGFLVDLRRVGEVDVVAEGFELSDESAGLVFG